MIRTVEQIIMSYAIRYTKLSELISKEFSNSEYANSDKVNIFIDINKICRSISQDNALAYTEDSFAICAGFLNLCAHYKSFFRSGYNVSTKIFLVYSDKTYFFNNRQIKDYMYYGSKVPDIKVVQDNLDLLSIITKYIPNVYFISTPYEICPIMKLVLTNDIVYESHSLNMKVPNIFITKDPYNWQTVNFNDFTVLCPVKYKGEDRSYSINRNNIYSSYLHIRNCDESKLQYNLDSGLYGLLLALTRVPERNIHSLVSIPKGLKVICNAIQKQYIPNGYFTPIPDALNMTLFDDIAKDFNINGYELRARLFAIDVISQYKFVVFNPTKSYSEDLVDMYDPKGIEEIDNKYFQKSKVDFGSLMTV